MGLLGDLGGPIGDLVGGWLGNEAAEDRQNAAQGFTRQMYQNRYQYTVKDMEAAGLNPMLAYSQGAGNPGGGSPVSAQSYGSPGTSFNQSRIASAQVANIEADTANKAAQGALFEAQANAANASAGQSQSQTTLNNETVNKVRQEVTNLQSSNEQIGATVANLMAQRQLIIAQTGNVEEATKQITATILKLQAEVPVLNSQAVRNAAAALLDQVTAGRVPSEITRNYAAARESGAGAVRNIASAGASDASAALDRELAKLRSFDVGASQDMMGLGQDAKQVKPIIDILRFFMRR